MMEKYNSQYTAGLIPRPLPTALLSLLLAGCAARPAVQPAPPPPDWVFYAESKYGFDHASECQSLDERQRDNPAAVAQAEQLANWKAERELRRRAKGPFRLAEGNYVIESVMTQRVNLGGKPYVCVLQRVRPTP